MTGHTTWKKPQKEVYWMFLMFIIAFQVLEITSCRGDQADAAREVVSRVHEYCVDLNQLVCKVQQR